MNLSHVFAELTTIPDNPVELVADHSDVAKILLTAKTLQRRVKSTLQLARLTFLERPIDKPLSVLDISPCHFVFSVSLGGFVRFVMPTLSLYAFFRVRANFLQKQQKKCVENATNLTASFQIENEPFDNLSILLFLQGKCKISGFPRQTHMDPKIGSLQGVKHSRNSTLQHGSP
jgi:hypothetical protein